MVNPSPISSPQGGCGVGVGQGGGVGVGVGIHGVNVSALARVKKMLLSKPPAAMISLLPEMNAPEGNERLLFMFAEVVHWSRDGSYTNVRFVVKGIKALSLAAALPTAMGNAVLVKSDATFFEPTAVLFLADVTLVVPEVALLEADAALVAELPGARKGLPPPNANNALSATALPGTLG